jgi:hypothetical protein
MVFKISLVLAAAAVSSGFAMAPESGDVLEGKDDGALIPRRIKALYNPFEVSKSKNHDYFLKK